MITKEASPEQIELFVKTATEKMVAAGKSEEEATQSIMAVLTKRAEELGLVQEPSDQPAPAGEPATARDMVIGLAHQNLVRSGMNEKQAEAALIKFIEAGPQA